MQIGRYEVLGSLGEGGSAKVLLAKSLASGLQVVLKVPLQTGPDQLERLRDEARVGLRLQHPGIVETLDLFEHEGKPILVVEHVDGASLQQIRRVGPLAPAAVVRVGRQVAEALDAIHSATDEAGASLNILHRDVTPANILITRGGDAKLIDLGIARSAETQARATQAGAVRGTLRYLAPELIEGQKHSAATDLWALGVVLWEAVLGRRAVVGDDREILTAILRGDVMKYQPGEALDPRLHDALAAFIAPANARLQRAKAAGNILGRLEAAFGDGQAPAQAAVDMAVRLAPDDDSIDIGDGTRKVLAASPQPVTMPDGEADDDEAGRKKAALDDSLDDGAATVQMQAVDIPPASNPKVASTAGPPVAASAPAAPSAVAPVNAGDLSDPVAGRYAKTEQAMPAVSAPPATDPAPQQATEPNPASPRSTTADGSPPLSASSPSAAPNTAVKGLSINEETEAAFDNPFDETVKRDETPGAASQPDNIKSTQLLHGGSGLPSLEAQTVQSMPAVDDTALDPALAETQLANKPPPAAPPQKAPLPAAPPTPAGQGPTGTAVNMPAPDLGLPGPPVAPPSAAAPPTAVKPSPGVPRQAAPPSDAAAATSVRPATDLAAAAADEQPNITAPQGTPVLDDKTAEAGPPEPSEPEPTAAPPPKTADAAPTKPVPAPPAAATPPAAGPDEPFGMTVTQAFFTKDIKDAIAREAEASVGPPTVEMEAAIAPVEGKIAAMIAGLVIALIVIVGGVVWLFGGDEEEDAPTGAAVVDAGTADAGVNDDAAETEEVKKADEAQKKKKTRKSKRRRKRKK